MIGEAESEFSHNLEFRFFHKLHRIIDAKDCCSDVNLSKNSNKSVKKSSAMGSKLRIMSLSCTISQQLITFAQTKKMCVCFFAITSQCTQVSEHGSPFAIFNLIFKSKLFLFRIYISSNLASCHLLFEHLIFNKINIFFVAYNSRQF
jgi:hypothetical protein